MDVCQILYISDLERLKKEPYLAMELYYQFCSLERYYIEDVYNDIYEILKNKFRDLIIHILISQNKYSCLSGFSMVNIPCFDTRTKISISKILDNINIIKNKKYILYLAICKKDYPISKIGITNSIIKRKINLDASYGKVKRMIFWKTQNADSIELYIKQNIESSNGKETFDIGDFINIKNMIEKKLGKASIYIDDWEEGQIIEYTKEQILSNYNESQKELKETMQKCLDLEIRLNNIIK